MLRASRGVDGRARGANLHLLFWLSLVPFATAWLGQNPTVAAPTVVYTIILFFCAIAYAILRQSLLRINSIDAPFASAVEIDIHGGLSIPLYVVAICTAFISPIVADVFLIAAAGLLLSRSARRASDPT
jgi:TMEM175 potassium channel family protein